jgi:hypothetical protein
MRAKFSHCLSQLCCLGLIPQRNQLLVECPKFPRTLRVLSLWGVLICGSDPRQQFSFQVSTLPRVVVVIYNGIIAFWLVELPSDDSTNGLEGFSA